MNSVLKLIALFLAFSVIVSCGLLPEEPDFCSEDDFYNRSFSGIKFDNYQRNDYMLFNRSKDSIPYLEQFSFSENGDFSILKIVSQNNKNDTITKLDGKFEIHKDKGYSWSVLELRADSIYEKQAINDTIIDSIYFSSDFTVSKFSGFSDNLLTDSGSYVPLDSSKVWETNSNCFDLNFKESSNSHPCNSGTFISKSRTFCLQQPEEVKNE